MFYRFLAVTNFDTEWWFKHFQVKTSLKIRTAVTVVFQINYIIMKQLRGDK